jgi:catechol 2,3-dioxygenase-like lactoylglutathione lyase family enzyme
LARAKTADLGDDPILKLDHLTIVVSDWRKSRDWYIRTLDFELDFEIPEDCTAAVKDDAEFTLILSQTDGGSLPASCALTIQVENVEARYHELVGAGIHFVHPPEKTFWGYGAELQDPDGYALRLWDQKSMRAKG